MAGYCNCVVTWSILEEKAVTYFIGPSWGEINHLAWLLLGVGLAGTLMAALGSGFFKQLAAATLWLVSLGAALLAWGVMTFGMLPLRMLRFFQGRA